jgi:hypothetical protein
MYQYHWLQVALDALADIYVAATVPDRERMAGGVDAFNTRLAHEPYDVGESRSGRFRVAFPPLLVVYFYISEPDQVVWVTRVRRYGR